MSTCGTFNAVSQPCIISMVYRMLVIIPLLALIGCTREGEGGPVMLSLSTPVGATAGASSGLAPDLTPGPQTGQLPLAQQSTDTTPFTSDGSLPGSDSSDNAPMITVTSTLSGVTVRLNWEHPADADTFGYYVYYGKQPAQEAGSCAAYESNQVVDAPPATIAGLEHDALYYFAVKNFGDSEDACSEEIMVATPPAHTS